jgi:hypothetical protein
MILNKYHDNPMRCRYSIYGPEAESFLGAEANSAFADCESVLVHPKLEGMLENA